MKFLFLILSATLSLSSFAQLPVEKSFQKLENKINNNIPAEYRATILKSVKDLRYSVETFGCGGSSSSVGYICKGYVKGYEYT